MDNIYTAIVAAAAAIVGGLITAVVGPLIKHKLEQAAAKQKQRQEQIIKWRQMILDVNRAVDGNLDPSDQLFIHPDYISFEPNITIDAKREVRNETITIVDGQKGLSYPLEILKNEIARVEKEWSLLK